MECFFACLLGLAVNLDNFMIGLSLGMRRQRISLQANLAGAVLLILFGVFCMFHNAEEGEQGYGVECWSEILILGVLMAINCIPPAFSAGAMGMNSAVVTLSAFVCALVCMGVSSHLGARLRSARGFVHMDQMAAALLILIGLAEMWIG